MPTNVDKLAVMRGQQFEDDDHRHGDRLVKVLEVFRPIIDNPEHPESPFVGEPRVRYEVLMSQWKPKTVGKKRTIQLDEFIRRYTRMSHG